MVQPAIIESFLDELVVVRGPMAEDGLFKVFKTLAGDGFQTLQTGGGLLRLKAGGAEDAVLPRYRGQTPLNYHLQQQRYNRGDTFVYHDCNYN